MAIPKTISQLDAAGPLSGAEQFPLVQNERTKKVSLNSLKDFTDTSCQCTIISRYDSIPNEFVGVGAPFGLSTKILEANTLLTDGSWIMMYVSGTFAANGNTKIVGLTIAQDAYSQGFDFSSGTYNNQTWEMIFRIQRISQTSFKIFQRYETTGNSTFISTYASNRHTTVTNNVDFNNDITLAIQSGGTVASSDVTLETWISTVNLVDPNS